MSGRTALFCSLLLLLSTPVGAAEPVVGGSMWGTSLDDEPEPPPQIVVPRDAEGQPLVDKAYALHFASGSAASYRQPLVGEALYSALGREDLAEAYTQRGRTRRALIAVGSVVLGLGAIAATSVLITGGISYSATDGASGGSLLTGGGAALGISVGVGVALILGGKLSSPHPVSSERLVRLVRRHEAKRVRSADELELAPADPTQGEGP